VASVHFSSQRSDWATPAGLFQDISDRWGPFDLDPCATPENAKCARFLTPEDDGLSQPWSGRVFMNPPYGRAITHWIRKAWEEAHRPGVVVVGLLPARTDTRWFHDHIEGCAAVHFLKGRVRFEGAPASAPFPSMIVVWGGEDHVSAAINY
jgi:phage N-6-adenine-methyltransferase